MGRVVDASSTSVSRSGWGSLTRWLCSNVTKSVARGAWPPTREHFPKTSSARTMRADPGTSGGPSAPLGVCCSFGMRPWPSPTIPTSHTSRRTSDGPFSAPYSRITHRALLSNLRRGFTGPSDMLTTQHPASSVLDIRLRINGLFHNAIFNGAVPARPEKTNVIVLFHSAQTARVQKHGRGQLPTCFTPLLMIVALRRFRNTIRTLSTVHQDGCKAAGVAGRDIRRSLSFWVV